MKIKEMRSNKIWAPFGFISDGMDDEYFADAQGDVWKVAEYGDKSYMWEFR